MSTLDSSSAPCKSNEASRRILGCSPAQLGATGLGWHRCTYTFVYRRYAGRGRWRVVRRLWILDRAFGFVTGFESVDARALDGYTYKLVRDLAA